MVNDIFVCNGLKMTNFFKKKNSSILFTFCSVSTDSASTVRIWKNTDNCDLKFNDLCMTATGQNTFILYTSKKTRWVHVKSVIVRERLEMWRKSVFSVIHLWSDRPKHILINRASKATTKNMLHLRNMINKPAPLSSILNIILFILLFFK